MKTAGLGNNVKLTLDARHRVAVVDMFVEVLGTGHQHPTPDFDVFTLHGGANIGVYWVSTDAALSPAQQSLGAWLEFLVDDAAATRDALIAHGLSELDYIDKAHHYITAPGGFVFRLAPR